VTRELRDSLDKLASMNAPSVEQILRARGYNYEANLIAELVSIWKRDRAPNCE
jgi:hypothetical protein